MASLLSRCPFCGSTPSMSEPREEQDRRYMVADVTCHECSLTMSAALPYGTFRTMSSDAIKDRLSSILVERWNRRDNEPEQAVIQAARDLVTAKDEKWEFEKEFPNDTTSRWDKVFDAVDTADRVLRASITNLDDERGT